MNGYKDDVKFMISFGFCYAFGCVNVPVCVCAFLDANRLHCSGHISCTTGATNKYNDCAIRNEYRDKHFSDV